jgi:hypothetical protein
MLEIQEFLDSSASGSYPRLLIAATARSRVSRFGSYATPGSSAGAW